MRNLPSSVYVVAMVAFLSSVGVGIVAPALPSLGVFFGVGVVAMTFAISGLSAARLFTNLFLARFMGRWAIRSVLIFGLAFQGTTTLVSALATDYSVFIVFRCIAGVGSGAFTIASTAMLIALAPANKRGSTMGLHTSAISLGAVSGPAIGAVLTIVSPTLPLFSYAAASLIAAVFAAITLRKHGHHRTLASTEPDADPEKAALDARRGIVRTLLSDRRIVAALACQVVSGWVFYGLRASYLPAYLEQSGYGVAFVGVMLSIAAITQIASSPGGALLSDRFGRMLPLTIAFVLALASLAFQVFAESVVFAILGFLLVGCAAGLLTPSSAALLADSPAGRGAAAAGIFWIAFDLASIIGPLSSGLLAEHVHPTAPLIAAAAVVVVAAAFALRGTPRRSTRR